MGVGDFYRSNMIMVSETLAIITSCIIIVAVIIISLLKIFIFGVIVDVLIINCVAVIVIISAGVIAHVNQIPLMNTTIHSDIRHLNKHTKAICRDWYMIQIYLCRAMVVTSIKDCITNSYMHRWIIFQSMTPLAFLINDNEVLLNRYGIYTFIRSNNNACIHGKNKKSLQTNSDIVHVDESVCFLYAPLEVTNRDMFVFVKISSYCTASFGLSE